jgi:hypothetical protein
LRSVEHYLERAVGDAESLLDVGCGANSPVGRFRRQFAYSVGVDLFPAAIEASKAAGFHSDCLLMDALDIRDQFGPDSFDVVVAFDLLEHLPHADGLKILALMEEVARRRVVVLTPNGFLPQGPCGGNPLQVHRSGWDMKQMRTLGYQVRGINGWRVLRGAKGSMRWRPARLWGLVSHFTHPIAYRIPSLAFHLLCVKDLGTRHPTASCRGGAA